jgi:hypothetical protein
MWSEHPHRKLNGDKSRNNRDVSRDASIGLEASREMPRMMALAN